jgi:hypothetical protein
MFNENDFGSNNMKDNIFDDMMMYQDEDIRCDIQYDRKIYKRTNFRI